MKATIKKKYDTFVVQVDYNSDFSTNWGPFTSLLKAKMWLKKYKKKYGKYWP